MITGMSVTIPVNTATLANRRILHFDTIDQAIAEGERLAGAEKAAKLHLIGNWSLGQIFDHLSSWVEHSYTGVPIKVPAPVRLVMKLTMKKKMLYQPMRPGSKIPRVPNGTLWFEAIPTDQGLARFKAGYTRLKSECPQMPNALFGPMTSDEWVNLHLRHAELHLGYGLTDPS